MGYKLDVFMAEPSGDYRLSISSWKAPRWPGRSSVSFVSVMAISIKSLAYANGSFRKTFWYLQNAFSLNLSTIFQSQTFEKP